MMVVAFQKSGFHCVLCASQTFVTDSRANVGRTVVRRRRECSSCHHRFTTYEVNGGMLENLLQLRADAVEELIAAMPTTLRPKPGGG